MRARAGGAAATLCTSGARVSDLKTCRRASERAQGNALYTQPAYCVQFISVQSALHRHTNTHVPHI